MNSLDIDCKYSIVHAVYLTSFSLIANTVYVTYAHCLFIDILIILFIYLLIIYYILNIVLQILFICLPFRNSKLQFIWLTLTVLFIYILINYRP